MRKMNRRTDYRGGGAFFIRNSRTAASALLTTADPEPKFCDQGGKVINNVQAQLIFWGGKWKQVHPTGPSPLNIVDAVNTILASSYMSQLHHYRSTIGSGTLLGWTVVSTPIGSSMSRSPGDPPPLFANDDVTLLVRNLVEARNIPAPDKMPGILYCVFLPREVRSGETTFDGEHFAHSLPANTSQAHIAWITNNGEPGKELDFVTSMVSHELVESCTDPEGTAILGVPGTCNQEGWCEIADITENFGRIQGVLVQSYWSDYDRKPVIPGQTSS